jgi:hypothetical protein
MRVSSLTLRKDPLDLQPSSFATIWVEGQRETKKGGREVADKRGVENKGTVRRYALTDGICLGHLEGIKESMLQLAWNKSITL